MFINFFKGIDSREKARKSLNFFGILFLFLFSVILTLSPAVRYRSWNVDYLWSHWAGFFIWLSGFLWFIRICSQRENLNKTLLIPLIGLLSGWGILSIWRINPIFGLRQSIWFLVSIFAASQIFKYPQILEIAKKYKYVLLLLGLTLAGLTFIFGTYPGGTGPRLWLGVHGLYFQPSELLKLLLIFYLAAYLSETRIERANLLNSILPALILFSSSLILLVAQRDMGTSLIFIAIFIFMLFIKFGKRRIFLFGLLFILAAAILGYLTIDLVRIRLLSWLAPYLDPQAGSYQIIQSLIAIAAGGITGSGIGLGSPRVIPISHSDFIYSAIVEETGLFGSVALLLIYALLFTRGIRIAIHSRDRYRQYLAGGISVYLASQAILIIGGNIRLLPITGVTLPFLSYGGSSFLISFVAVCFLLIIENEKYDQPPKHPLPIKTTSILSGIFLGSYVLLALTTGWWSFIRSDNLQLRADNPRHFIAARYVRRGSILDRNDQTISQSIGEIGNYVREIEYPPLSNTVGYSNSAFGNAGLENELDDYLSGERGYPAFNLWFNYLLYDQPLPGRDVRLTLDMKVQKRVDVLIGNHTGSAVVMNAGTGDLLAIASHPYYNANQIGQNLDQWQSDISSPLLNRATQGAYPIGNLITPFLLSKSNLSDEGQTYFEYVSKFQLDQCAINAYPNNTLASSATDGCDSALIRTADSLKPSEIEQIISEFSLSGSQNIGLPINENEQSLQGKTWYDLIFGDSPLRVNPLQIAASASAFSANGLIPDAKITSAVNITNEGWVTLNESSSQRVLDAKKADQINDFLNSEAISGWEVTATSRDENGIYSWYLAGTPNSWPGTPIVVVVVLERDNPDFVQLIGREIYRSATE